MIVTMTDRAPFTHAVPNPSVRRDIALAVRDGISPEQLAAEFNISISTVRAYAWEWEGAQRRLRSVDPWERESIIHACHRGGRRRWERQYGAEVVRELLGEEQPARDHLRTVAENAGQPGCRRRHPLPSHRCGMLQGMHLDYLVIYASDPAASAAWYTDALALRFIREQHGSRGPVHYSTVIDGGVVLELYPAAGDRPVTRTRIGLSVPDPYDVRPEPTTITDPDGNTIEVTARAGEG